MIATFESLESTISKALQHKCVAVDTEFVWERTYYPKLGLIQIAFGDEGHLIDPVAINDLSPLKDLLEAENVQKIFHDAFQDLCILHRATGAFPRNIFDTRTASGFAGSTSTLSLATMLKETVNIELPKTESRTNWLQRPLSDKQIEYALDDVIHMCKARDILVERSKKLNTYQWFQEDMSFYDNPEIYPEYPIEERYLKEKGTGRFTPLELAIFRELASWRERQARKRDLPRNFIIHDQILHEIVRRKPDQVKDLKKVKTLKPKQKERHGHTIVQLVRKGLNLPSHQWPHRPNVNMDWDKLKKRVDKILKKIRSEAEKINIDSALITSRKELNRIIIHQINNSSLQKGWRGEIICKLDINLG